MWPTTGDWFGHNSQVSFTMTNGAEPTYTRFSVFSEATGSCEDLSLCSMLSLIPIVYNRWELELFHPVPLLPLAKLGFDVSGLAYVVDNKR